MTDPTQPGQPGQPSEEELRAHLAELREADAAEIVVQAVNMFATGAQVKLGRADARVLIDAISAVADAVDGHLAPDLVRQVRDAVGQLQMAQVQAEREEAASGVPGSAPAGAGAPGGRGQEDAAAPRGSRPGTSPPGSTEEQTGGEKMTDRLWIPGREPGTG